MLASITSTAPPVIVVPTGSMAEVASTRLVSPTIVVQGQGQIDPGLQADSGCGSVAMMAVAFVMIPAAMVSIGAVLVSAFVPVGGHVVVQEGTDSKGDPASRRC